MASLLSGAPLPNISSTTTNATTAPDYYNTSASDIAKIGQTTMNADPNSMIAGQSALTQYVQDTAKDTSNAYQTPVNAAINTATGVAQGITPSQVNAFMNPYQQDVVSGMANLTNQNVQNNILPALQAASGATGQFGSQRAANAAANALSNVQSNLTAQQASQLNTGYQNAVQSALQNAGLQNTAANTLNNLGQTDITGAHTANTDLSNIGATEQAYRQSIINEPMTAATNAANALSTLKIPSTTTSTYVGPGQSGQYGTSPLGAITGLGALFASGSGGTSPFQGVMKGLSQLFPTATQAPGTGTTYQGNNPGSVSGTDYTGGVPNDTSQIYIDPTTGATFDWSAIS